MMNLTFFIAVLALLALIGYAQKHYLKRNLNQISLGQIKLSILTMVSRKQLTASKPSYLI